MLPAIVEAVQVLSFSSTQRFAASSVQDESAKFTVFSPADFMPVILHESVIIILEFAAIAAEKIASATACTALHGCPLAI